MHEFGLACLRTRRFDTSIPWQYMSALADMTEDIDGDKRYWKQPETWTRLQIIFDGYGKANNPYIGSADKCQSIKAAIAAYCERYADARKILNALGSRLDIGLFKQYYKEGGADPVRTVQSLGSPYGQQMQHAEKLHSLEAYGQAIATYEKLRESVKDDEYAHAYVEDRIEAIGMEKGLAEGRWVDLKPHLDSDNWTATGDWKIEADGTTVGACTNAGFSLLCNTTLADNVEVRGEMEFAEENPRSSNAGVLLYSSASHRFVYFYQGADWALAGCSVPDNTGIVKDAGVKNKNTFLVQQWKGAVTVHLNGKLLHDAYALRGYSDDDKNPRVGVGGWFYQNGTTVKFRNLQVRRLTEKPVDSSP
jgi:hypothetical protein